MSQHLLDACLPFSNGVFRQGASQKGLAMRFQRLAVLSATALMFISGCSAGRSLTSSSGSGGKGVSSGHEAYDNNPPAVDFRAYEPAPVPPAMGISLTKTIGFRKTAGCGQAPCVHEPDCVAPPTCVVPSDCVHEEGCTADSCGECGFFGRLKCWPKRRATCAFPPVACVPEAACVQEYAEPLCATAICAAPCGEAPCGDVACCGEGTGHRCCLTKLFSGRLFKGRLMSWRRPGRFCSVNGGCTDRSCGAEPSCGQMSAAAGSPAASPSDHSSSATPRGMSSDPFAPKAPATQDAPPPPPADAPEPSNDAPQPPADAPQPPAVPAAPGNVPEAPAVPPAPAAPAAPAAEQTWVEPLIWPRLNTVTEPTMVVQPRDFSTQSIGWSGI